MTLNGILLLDKINFYSILMHYWASLVAQMIRESKHNAGDPWALGQEDPLQKGMATHYNIFLWRVPSIGEPGELQSMGSQRVRYN